MRKIAAKVVFHLAYLAFLDVNSISFTELELAGLSTWRDQQSGGVDGLALSSDV